MRYMRRLFFLILFVTLAENAAANIFDEIQRCFTDPCSCGFSDKTERWYSDGYDIYTLSRESYRYPAVDNLNEASFHRGYSYSESPRSLCPPYNKFGGREGCLLQFKPPTTYSKAANGNWRITCAEASRNVSFTNPVIKARMQACNAFACFTYSGEFNAAQGQCRVWPTQWGIPTIRHCARVSIPRLSIDDSTKQLTMTPDEGYQFHFLDTNGIPRPDPGVITSDGQRVFLPKICLYEDPSVWTRISGGYMEPYRNSSTDWEDTVENRMPYHTKGPGSNQTELQFLDILSGMSKNKIIEHSFWYQSKDEDAYLPFRTSSITTFNPDIEGMEYFGFKVDMRWRYDYENWLKDFVANKKDSLGCAFLPIGPFPPPFCQVPATIDSTLTAHRICSVDYSFNKQAGKMILQQSKSTISDPCVQSRTRNNFIYNSIRVSSDEVIQICGRDDNPANKDCVKFHPETLSPQAVNLLGDRLPLCTSNSPTDSDPPCVITRVTNKCKASMNCDPSKFRIIYFYETPSTKQQVYGYPSDALGQCGGSGYPCVSLGGINTGEYADIVIDLGHMQNLDSIEFVEIPDMTISGKNNTQFSFSTFLTYFGSANEKEVGPGQVLDGNSICVFFKDKDFPIDMQKAGCIPRAPPPPFTISACSDVNLCYSAEERALFPASPLESLAPYARLLHFKPKIKLRVSYQGTEAATDVIVPNDEYSAVVGVNNRRVGPYGEQASNSNNGEASTDTTKPYYIALGLLLDSIATDDTYELPPFGSSKAYPPGSLTIFGEYEGLTIPLNADSTPIANTKYLRGLEYTNGEYLRGAKRLSVAAAEYNICHFPAAQSLQPSASTTKPGFDDTNCVLTKLNYADTVDCDKFNAKNAPLRCTRTNLTCPIDSTLPIAGGTDVIKFRKCTGNSNTGNYVDTICYEADTLTQEICKTDTDPRHRILPEYSEGQAHTDEFYNFTDGKVTSGYCAARNEGENFNKVKCGIRDKTIVERGFTIPVPPPPACPAVSTPSPDTGNATWSKAEVGEDAVATCERGYKPPTTGLDGRTCYLDENRALKIEPITPTSTCTKMVCAAEAAMASNGFASWTQADFNQLSTAQCPIGYAPPPSGFSPRKCIANESNTDALLEPTKPEEFCFKDTTMIVDPKTTIKITTDSNFASVSPWTSSTWTETGSEEYCRYSLGWCLDWGRRNVYYDYNVYTIKIGPDSYWSSIDANGNASAVAWSQYASPGEIKEYNVTMTGSVGQEFFIANLRALAGIELVSMQVITSSTTDCTARDMNGFSTCSGDTVVGIRVNSPISSPTATIKVLYRNTSESSTGAVVSFDVRVIE